MASKPFSLSVQCKELEGHFDSVYSSIRELSKELDSMEQLMVERYRELEAKEKRVEEAVTDRVKDFELKQKGLDLSRQWIELSAKEINLAQGSMRDHVKLLAEKEKRLEMIYNYINGMIDLKLNQFKLDVEWVKGEIQDLQVNLLKFKTCVDNFSWERDKLEAKSILFELDEKRFQEKSEELELKEERLEEQSKKFRKKDEDYQKRLEELELREKQLEERETQFEEFRKKDDEYKKRLEELELREKQFEEHKFKEGTNRQSNKLSGNKRGRSQKVPSMKASTTPWPARAPYSLRDTTIRRRISTS
ncbi:hypothetical protein JCGZ_11641 [Jatropha curcas]|uniref:Uncharacterized protein n=1 Tax=Jatropha curcas TaxID=180498 RepID=A0A067KG96_JATCU|nr:cilia- and flagella-associated protein 57 [Jatropha curcas]KDP31265.1 hypothetical protein JCGZ_11641 [Jatropha curcas]